MNKLKRETYILLAGLISFAVGILLRLNASGMSWPQEYSYSGEREDTVWAIRELALIEIGTALFIFGLVVILLVIAKLLFFKDTGR